VPPIYVAKLFELLRFLRVEPRAVIQEVGLDKHTVSRLTHGARPLPKAYVQPFFRFVHTKLLEGLAEAKARDRPLGSTALTGKISSSTLFEREVMDRLAAWELELYDRKGDLTQAVQRSLEELASYRTQDVSKLSTEDRRRLYETTQRLRKDLRVSSFLRDAPTERLLKAPAGRDDLPPDEYFMRLTQWAGSGE
jgi:hypothetical protein